MGTSRTIGLFYEYCTECSKLWGKQFTWRCWDRRDPRLEAFAGVLELAKEQGIEPDYALRLVAEQAWREQGVPVPPDMITGDWGRKTLEKALENVRVHVAPTPKIAKETVCLSEIRKLGETQRALAHIVKSTYGHEFDLSWVKVFSPRCAKQVAAMESSFPNAFVDLSSSYRRWRKINKNHSRYQRFVVDSFIGLFPNDIRSDWHALVLS